MRNILALLVWPTAHAHLLWQVTMYPQSYLAQLPKMGDHTGTAYSMSHGPGRSYRYYKGVSADARFCVVLVPSAEPALCRRRRRCSALARG